MLLGGGGGGGGCNSELLINLGISLEQSACHSMCVQRCSIML